jgi:hypothetical protein
MILQAGRPQRCGYGAPKTRPRDRQNRLLGPPLPDIAGIRILGVTEKPEAEALKNLSDPRLRCRETKLLYPNHRSPPGLTEDAAPRSLEPIVRRRAGRRDAWKQVTLPRRNVGLGTNNLRRTRR